MLVVLGLRAVGVHRTTDDALEWSPPEDAGGAPVDGYKVYVYDDGEGAAAHPAAAAEVQEISTSATAPRDEVQVVVLTDPSVEGDDGDPAAAIESFWCQLGLLPPCPKGDASPAALREPSETSRRKSRSNAGKASESETSEAADAAEGREPNAPLASARARGVGSFGICRRRRRR